MRPGSENVTDLDVTGLAFEFAPAFPAAEEAEPFVAQAASLVASFTSWNFSMN